MARLNAESNTITALAKSGIFKYSANSWTSSSARTPQIVIVDGQRNSPAHRAGKSSRGPAKFNDGRQKPQHRLACSRARQRHSQPETMTCNFRAGPSRLSSSPWSTASTHRRSSANGVRWDIAAIPSSANRAGGVGCGKGLPSDS